MWTLLGLPLLRMLPLLGMLPPLGMLSFLRMEEKLLVVLTGPLKP